MMALFTQSEIILLNKYALYIINLLKIKLSKITFILHDILESKQSIINSLTSYAEKYITVFCFFFFAFSSCFQLIAVKEIDLS